MLFFAGLGSEFRHVVARRLRYFLLACLGVFTLVEALGRTELSLESPGINSENLLVLLVPLVLLYGTAFFLTCLDRFELPLLESKLQLRYVVMVGFALVMCLPAIGRRFADKTNPVVFPPYYPPEIQIIAGWMKPGELLMSDVPWAVAWYGHRQCVWLTLNTADDFYALNDFVKPVRGLYLTPETLDRKLLTGCLETPSDSWGNFVLAKATMTERAFPLRVAPVPGVINSGLFLTDRERWLAGE